MYGDTIRYKDERKPNVFSIHGQIAVRSLQWPGSVTMFFNGKYISLYVGCGHKADGIAYYPTCAPVVLGEPDDSKILEQHEV